MRTWIASLSTAIAALAFMLLPTAKNVSAGGEEYYVSYGSLLLRELTGGRNELHRVGLVTVLIAGLLAVGLATLVYGMMVKRSRRRNSEGS